MALLVALFILLGIGLGLVDLIWPLPRPEHYSGSFGDTRSPLQSYDAQTQAEHEESAANGL